MKILITGSKGMLGTDLMNASSNHNYQVVGFGHQELDITKKGDILKIKKEKPDIVINCAAYKNVDQAETDKEACYAVNFTGVKNLADTCKNIGATLIHISTDYIFNGEKESYEEDDSKDPLNIYGKTKSEGEDYIIKNLDKYYIIRTSWLFGKNGKNFVETIKKLCSEKEQLNVVNDQKGRPTNTMDLSDGIINIIKNPERHKFGIYHLTNDGSCTWFEFASEIARLTNSRCKINPCTTEEFPRPAKRPRFSILNNNKTEKLRHWKEALATHLNK